MKMLVCENLEDLEFFMKIQKLTKENKSEWVIFTTDFCLYTKAEELQLTIVLLDCDESSKIFETTQLLKEINKGIFGNINKPYLVEFNYSIEGAGIEQDIADMLYNYKFCQEICEQYNWEYIHLFCKEKTHIECEIIIEIAKQKGIPLKIYYGKGGIQSLKNYLLYSNTYFNMYLKYVYYLFMLAIEFIKCLGYSIKNLQNVKKEKTVYELGVIWGSDAIKHMNWCREKIKTYCMHLRVNVICKFTKQSCVAWNEQGVSATLFDYSYLHIKEYIRAIIEYLKALKKILITLKDFRVENYYIYLYKPIKHRILQQVLINAPRGFIMDAIAKEFYKWNQYKYIETWLGSNNIYSRIAYYNTRKEGTVFFRIQTGEITIIKSTEYEEVDKEMLHWCFFIGKTMKTLGEFYKKTGWTGEAIFLDGKGWKSLVKKKKNDEEFSILWAPSYPLKGYFSERAFNKMNDKILEELSKLNVNLYVKYHPTHPQKSINFILEKYKNYDIFFECKEHKVEDLIEKSDLVVTTSSSIIVDSIKMSTPVVIIREGDMMQMEKIFETSKAVFWNISVAIEYIKRLVYDKRELQEVLEEENKKMIKIYGEEMGENCYNRIVKRIIDDML